LKKNVIFFIKKEIIILNLLKDLNNRDIFLIKTTPNIITNNILKNQQKFSKKINKSFLKKSITFFKIVRFLKKNKKSFYFLFFNKFILNFLENFFKFKIFLNIKKGSNKIALKHISYRSFFLKYFKRNLKVSKQIIGILYYSFLLKDASIFVSFLKRVLEKLNVKLHKKIFLGLKKIIKDFFKPLFSFLGVLGILFNIKGKIGVSGNAKKRRYYFYFGKHSLTKKTTRVDLKYLPV